MREICQSGSMSGNRKQSYDNPDCGDDAKASSTATGRLTLLRRFSTLLRITLKMPMPHLGRKLGVVVAAILAATVTFAGKAGDKSDDRYLLVRRAGPPLKNYYDLSRTAQLWEPQLFNDTFFSRYQPSPKGMGIDVITETTVRYGNYQVWKVRVLASYDTDKAAGS